LTGAYRSRPAYQKNDYLSRIKSAKRPSTRDERLKQMLSELKGGARYMKMAWSSRRSRR
jgi:hypothetical protein